MTDIDGILAIIVAAACGIYLLGIFAQDEITDK